MKNLFHFSFYIDFNKTHIILHINFTLELRIQNYDVIIINATYLQKFLKSSRCVTILEIIHSNTPKFSNQLVL